MMIKATIIINRKKTSLVSQALNSMKSSQPESTRSLLTGSNARTETNCSKVLGLVSSQTELAEVCLRATAVRFIGTRVLE